MICKASARDAAGPVWFKSSYSSGTDGESCVEIAIAPGAVHVRDSKNVEGPQLALSPDAWADFTAYASTS